MLVYQICALVLGIIEMGDVSLPGISSQSQSQSLMVAQGIHIILRIAGVGLCIYALSEMSKKTHAQAGPGRPPPLTAPEEGGLEADPLVRMFHFSFCALKNSR
jgi:hypothetical protein